MFVYVYDERTIPKVKRAAAPKEQNIPQGPPNFKSKLKHFTEKTQITQPVGCKCDPMKVLRPMCQRVHLSQTNHFCYQSSFTYKLIH